MLRPTDLRPLKQKLHDDYHNLKSRIHDVIENSGSDADLESFYENLMESAFEVVSQCKVFCRQNRDFKARVAHRIKMRQDRTPILYPHPKKLSHGQPI